MFISGVLAIASPSAVADPLKERYRRPGDRAISQAMRGHSRSSGLASKYHRGVKILPVLSEQSKVWTKILACFAACGKKFRHRSQ
jgi:hypothetical protein